VWFIRKIDFKKIFLILIFLKIKFKNICFVKNIVGWIFIYKINKKQVYINEK
jgi:hypothetical protein